MYKNKYSTERNFSDGNIPADADPGDAASDCWRCLNVSTPTALLPTYELPSVHASFSCIHGEYKDYNNPSLVYTAAVVVVAAAAAAIIVLNSLFLLLLSSPTLVLHDLSYYYHYYYHYTITISTAISTNTTSNTMIPYNTE